MIIFQSANLATFTLFSNFFYKKKQPIPLTNKKYTFLLYTLLPRTARFFGKKQGVQKAFGKTSFFFYAVACWG